MFRNTGLFAKVAVYMFKGSDDTEISPDREEMERRSRPADPVPASPQKVPPKPHPCFSMFRLLGMAQ